ncbi:MAG: hypothetical protein ACI4IW_05180 [Oscillospiraceae bacterium]
MKRVQSACICQTLHFVLKEEILHDEAVSLVNAEVEKYKADLEKSGSRYKILDEHRESDGSVIIKIIKQYSNCDVGDYMD